MKDDEITDWLYNALKEIEDDENVRLSDRAFVADHLTPKIQKRFGKQEANQVCPEICNGCPTFEKGCEGSNQEDCARQVANPMREKELRRILLPRIVGTTVRERVIAQILALFPIEEAKRDARKQVVDWIQSNAIYSHEPSCEHIDIWNVEWMTLLKGEIPKEREHIKFK